MFAELIAGKTAFGNVFPTKGNCCNGTTPGAEIEALPGFCISDGNNP